MLDIIPNPVINKWEILIGKEKCDDLEREIFEFFINKISYLNNSLAYEFIIEQIKQMTSYMDLNESEKKGIIDIFQDEIKDCPDHFLKEIPPYAKRIMNKYFLVSKKYPFESIKKYKSNNKHMLILASGK